MNANLNLFFLGRLNVTKEPINILAKMFIGEW